MQVHFLPDIQQTHSKHKGDTVFFHFKDFVIGESHAHSIDTPKLYVAHKKSYRSSTDSHKEQC